MFTCTGCAIVICFTNALGLKIYGFTFFLWNSYMRKVFCRCFDISATLHQDLRENFDTNVKTQKCIEVSSPLFCRSKVSIVNILNIVTILNIVKFVTILNIVNIVTILNIVNIVNIMPHLLDEIKLTQLSRKARKKAPLFEGVFKTRNVKFENPIESFWHIFRGIIWVESAARVGLVAEDFPVARFAQFHDLLKFISCHILAQFVHFAARAKFCGFSQTNRSRWGILHSGLKIAKLSGSFNIWGSIQLIKCTSCGKGHTQKQNIFKICR